MASPKARAYAEAILSGLLANPAHSKKSRAVLPGKLFDGIVPSASTAESAIDEIWAFAELMDAREP